MNKLIIATLTGFTVDGTEIPVSFMRYTGHGEPYITFNLDSRSGSLSGDCELLGYVAYYDFDVYTKGNILKIVDELIDTLEDAGFTWQPSRSSGDLYDDDTEYYHRTLNFAIPIMEG